MKNKKKILFSKKQKQEILFQEACTTRNVKGSSSDIRKMTPKRNLDLHKGINSARK